MIAANAEEAERLISNLNGKPFGEGNIFLSIAREDRKGKMKPMQHYPSTSEKERISGTENQKKKPSHNAPLADGKPDMLQLSTNETFVTEVGCSLLLHTVNRETTESVGVIVEGLGFEGVRIRGLSSSTFLAYFSLEEDLNSLDVDFLKIGFKEVHKVDWADLKPSRKVWIECRGLPLVAWKEDNFSKIVDKWGKILDYAPILDKENFFQCPRFLVETSSLHTIDETNKVLIQGKEWTYRLVEVFPSSSVANIDWTKQSNSNEEGSEIPFQAFTEGCVDHTNEEDQDQGAVDGAVESSESNSSTKPSSRQNVESLKSAETKKPEGKADGSNLEDNQLDSEQDDPTTPRDLPLIFIPEFEQPMEGRWNWCTGDQSDSLSKSPSSENMEESIEGEDNESINTHPSIIQNLQSLMIKSKRGRPRKFNKQNKFFKVPKQRKRKGFKQAQDNILRE